MGKIKFPVMAALVLMVSLMLMTCELHKNPVLIGLVTDNAGICDRSFNASALKGIQDARRDLGIQGSYSVTRDGDFSKKIQRFIRLDCDLIITMSYKQAEATQTAALANPARQFAIVDHAYGEQYANVLQINFQTDQAAFLAGYAAAATTKTGTVATFGGMKIGPVELFMDGFALGARYYNQQHGADIAVLGWNPDTRTGLFTGNFDNRQDSLQIARGLIAAGADIIMPVAGLSAQGAAEAAQQQAGVFIIGVDTDWAVFAPEHADLVFTSVLKKIDTAVHAAIASVVSNSFAGGTYLGTLENDGVGIGQINWPDPAIGSGIEDELAGIKTKIISGALSTRAGE